MQTNLPIESLKRTISYFYLVSFCPPDLIQKFLGSTAPMRQDIARKAGMTEAEFFPLAVPEVSRRIVAFHQATREPEQAVVDALAKAASDASRDLSHLGKFQEQMKRIATLPGRARPENRLHRNKGCAFCQAPCQYGFFSLVSEPSLQNLHLAMAFETEKPPALQSPLSATYGFAVYHIGRLTGASEIFVSYDHLIHLSYCLLLLGMAKSRMTPPEAQLRLLQAANQEFIRRQDELSASAAAPVKKAGGRKTPQKKAGVSKGKGKK